MNVLSIRLFNVLVYSHRLVLLFVSGRGAPFCRGWQSHGDSYVIQVLRNDWECSVLKGTCSYPPPQGPETHREEGGRNLRAKGMEKSLMMCCTQIGHRYDNHGCKVTMNTPNFKTMDKGCGLEAPSLPAYLRTGTGWLLRVASVA